MRFLIYGEAENIGSGAWCYAESLREMGHDVVTHSDQSGLERYASSLPLRIFRRLTRSPLPRDRARHAALVIDHAKATRPDVVIVLKGLLLSRADVLSLRGFGARVVNINHDDFFSANPNNWSPLQRDAIPAYDFIFTTRAVNVDEVRPLNRNVEFLPFAYYPRIHRRVPIPPSETAAWSSDVVFVGTWERERAAQLEELVRYVPARYAIWGGQWNRLSARSPLRPYAHLRPVYLDDMAKAIAGSRVALAFLRKANRDDYTQRTFEIPACGGLLLAERTPQHQQYYLEGTEAEFFDSRNVAELASKLKGLLDDSQRAERIRSAGLARLLAGQHTYRDRLSRLVEVIRNLPRVT
jgi:hypothetical protein